MDGGTFVEAQDRAGIGMLTYLSPPENVEEMIRRADDLMYSVKRGGKNNIKHEVMKSA